MNKTLENSNSSAHLDPSFGDGGRVIVPISESPGEIPVIKGIAIDSSGAIFFASASADKFVLGRLLKDGTLDAGFGNNGFVRDIFAEGTSLSTSVSLLENGSILLMGTHVHPRTRRMPGLALFSASGQYITGFGQNGKTVVPLPLTVPENSADLYEAEFAATSSSSTGPIMLPNGKLLLVYENVLIRLLRNGMPDPDFDNGNHYRRIQHPKYPSSLTRIVKDSAGTVVVSGTAQVNGKSTGVLVRCFTDGHIDRRFGEDGFVVLSDLDFNSNITALVPLKPHKVLAVGQKTLENRKGYMVCLDEQGKFDTSFNGGKPVLVPSMEDVEFSWHTATVDHIGRIVATGGSFGGLPFIPVGRFLPNGQPDLTFSRNEGWIRIEGQLSETVTLDDQGRIVFGGYTSSSPIPLTTVFGLMS
ncbi:hypothetical protein [Pseudomonas vancouverensis]|uniref:Uncharacterized protein n=1 Tax=Pseudomonas vancouverensis TaxID=95300 RepID=A0A1H2NJM2_PSEVA|nr:hypothetical protein [Pseudomonas vancouverensis]KAB0495140.1 hypothetical protein F7R09_16290 [Pseudomonas vancouverensis]TDB57099.1 hypothetical protein EIY72_27595 [Pseudomonas vancouverensis]SDV05697.1 delta-60 repeat domain-containing protein [Pseudomonas vancouverensis]